MISMSLSATTVRPTAPARGRSVACRASAAKPVVVQSAKVNAASRREVLKMGTAAMQLLMAGNALAILPGNDDEDEELLAKAKAKRSAQIQSERSLEKQYVSKNQLKQDEDVGKYEPS